MKKSIYLLLITIFVLTLSACNQVEESNSNSQLEVLKVGATSVPHAEILNEIKPLIEKEGIYLEIIEYQDYVQPNIHLSEGELDANYFQHIPYFDSFTSERKIDNLYNALKVHIEPMGIYSNEITDLSQIKNGASVSIPNDPSNMGRALLLLEKAELIKLDENAGIKATINDITVNSKDLEIIPLESPMLPRSLEDVDLSVINTNYALQANLNPTNDALFIEDADSPYANVLTIRNEDREDENIKKLIKALSSEEVRNFINSNYKGVIIPVF